MSILIKHTQLKNKTVDVRISGNHIEEISPAINVEADFKISGKDRAIAPSFYNTHTHAAMTLFRGYADDIELHRWLSEMIWPKEANINEDDVYWGTKLACLEMIKSGTTFFADMYFYPRRSAQAAMDMGVRALICEAFFDVFAHDDKEKRVQKIKSNISEINESCSDGLVCAGIGPHAVYTVSKERLQWAKEYADKNSLLLMFHLSETRKEVEDCKKQYGKRPVDFLDDIGFLGPNLIAAHCIWLTKDEIKTLAKHDVKVSHNPVSNMKLATGGVMPYPEMKQAGLTVSMGTDGCGSNNNLDISESAKVAALLQKSHRWDQTVLPAKDAFDIITENGAKAIGINAGRVKEGMLADLTLIRTDVPEMVPTYNLVSNLIYSANGSAVDTTICNGKILMQNRQVEGEREIIEKARDVASDFIHRGDL